MIAFRRHSTCPMLPDLIRDAAEARSARWARMIPVEIWTRPSTTLLLRARGNLPVAPCGVVHLASAPDSDRLRDEGQRFVAAASLRPRALCCASDARCCARVSSRPGMGRWRCNGLSG